MIVGSDEQEHTRRKWAGEMTRERWTRARRVSQKTCEERRRRSSELGSRASEGETSRVNVSAGVALRRSHVARRVNWILTRHSVAATNPRDDIATRFVGIASEHSLTTRQWRFFPVSTVVRTWCGRQSYRRLAIVNDNGLERCSKTGRYRILWYSANFLGTGRCNYDSVICRSRLRRKTV